MAVLFFSCQSEEKTALKTAQSVIELSDNIKPNIYKPSWKNAQAEWEKTLRNTTEEKVVAKHLLTLSKHINQDKISPKWEAMKFAWEADLTKAKNIYQVRYLIIEFEEYTRPAMKKSWEKDREKWFTTIDQLR